MKAKALLDALAETVEKKRTETLIKRLVKVKAETLVDALLDTLSKEEPKTLSEHLPMGRPRH